jgi:rod shape-determining protein MreD
MRRTHAPPSDRRSRVRGNNRLRVTLVIGILVLLEFYLIPSLVESRLTPDFLLVGLLLLVVQQPPGLAALSGLLMGLVVDVLTPARFGAGMLAHTLVALGAAWGRAVFFADNLFVAGALFFIGTWVRDILVLMFSGTTLAQLAVEAGLWAPLHGLTTAAVGVMIVVLFRDWLAIRIER